MTILYDLVDDLASEFRRRRAAERRVRAMRAATEYGPPEELRAPDYGPPASLANQQGLERYGLRAIAGDLPLSAEITGRAPAARYLEEEVASGAFRGTPEQLQERRRGFLANEAARRGVDLSNTGYVEPTPDMPGAVRTLRDIAGKPGELLLREIPTRDRAAAALTESLASIGRPLDVLSSVSDPRNRRDPRITSDPESLRDIARRAEDIGTAEGPTTQSLRTIAAPVAEAVIPRQVWEVAIEFAPGIGSVSDLKTLYREGAPEAIAAVRRALETPTAQRLAGELADETGALRVGGRAASNAGTAGEQATQAAAPSQRFAAPLRDFQDVRAEVETTDNAVKQAVLAKSGINPSIADDSPVGTALTAYARQHIASDELTQTAVTAALDSHRAPLTGMRPIRINGKGEVTNIAVSSGQSRIWQDVFSRPDAYNLTAEQRAYIDDFLQVIDEVEGLRVGAGLRPLAKRGPDGWFYVPRQVKGVRGIDLRRPSKPALQRIYDEAAEGVAKGIRYDTDPRATLELHVRNAYREIAEKQLSDALEEVSLTAKDLVPASTRDRMANAIKARRQAETQVRNLRFQVAATRDVPKARGKYQLLQKAQQDLEAARAEYTAAKNAYGRAMQHARNAEVSPGALWGPNQPDTIAIGQWRNRFFPREQSDRLAEVMGGFRKPGQKQNIVWHAFESLADHTRFLSAVGDFAAPFIQGLPVLARDPGAWFRATAMHYAAWVDPTIQARFVRDHLETFQAMARNGVPIGDTEFFRAAQEGRGATIFGQALERTAGQGARQLARSAGKQTIGRFEASYNTFLAMSRAQLWESLAKTVPDEAERARLIRNMTGGLDPRALGVSPDRRGFEAMWVAFSPRLLRSTLALAGDALKGPFDPVGREAIRSLGTLAAGATGLYIAAGVALGKSWPEIREGLNPLNGKRFLSYQVNGDWIGIGGQMRALTQLIAGVSADVYTSTKEGELPKTISSFDSQENPLIAFAMSRGAPGQNLAGGVIEAATGGKVDTLPYEQVDGAPSLINHIGTSALPFTLQNYLEGQKPLTLGAALGGARTSGETPREKADAALRAAGVEKGLGADKRDIATARESNEDVANALDALDASRAETFPDSAKYQEQVQSITSLQERADQQFQAGEITGAEWREQYKRNNALLSYVRAQQDFSGGKPDPVLDRYYAFFQDPQYVDQATGVVIDDRLFDATDQYVASLSPEDRAHIEANVGWGKTTPEVRAYREASDKLDAAGWWNAPDEAFRRLGYDKLEGSPQNMDELIAQVSGRIIENLRPRFPNEPEAQLQLRARKVIEGAASYRRYTDAVRRLRLQMMSNDPELARLALKYGFVSSQGALQLAGN